MKAVLLPRETLGWIEGRAKCCLTSNAHGMAAVDDSGRIRGMVAYENFTPGSCQVHVAVETPVAWRALIPACFEYPFDTLGLCVVVGVTPANNAQALRMNKRLGFREAHRVRDGWARGVDMVVQELRREDCARFSRLPEREAA